MPKTSKKKAVKRAYNKKPKLVSVEPVQEMDTELKSLAAICSIFDNWTIEQKARNIIFLASKYGQYLNK